MIPKGAFMRVVDNSGARLVQVRRLCHLSWLLLIWTPACPLSTLACPGAANLTPLPPLPFLAPWQVIGMYGHTGQYAGIGNVVKVAVKESKGEKVGKGEMKKAVVVETRYPTHRHNGSHVQYSRNACVLLSEKGTPVGSRVRSMLSWEFVKPRWKRLASLGGRLF